MENTGIPIMSNTESNIIYLSEEQVEKLFTPKNSSTSDNVMSDEILSLADLNPAEEKN